MAIQKIKEYLKNLNPHQIDIYKKIIGILLIYPTVRLILFSFKGDSNFLGFIVKGAFA